MFNTSLMFQGMSNWKALLFFLAVLAVLAGNIVILYFLLKQ